MCRLSQLVPRTLALRSALALCCVAAPVGRAAAQSPVDASGPRGLVDPSFAVRLEIDRLAESVRRGEASLRVYPDPAFAAAVQELAAAVRGRTRPPPHPELGAAWDFRFDSLALRADGPARLHVRGYALLATDPAGVVPVELTFGRNQGRWELESYAALTSQLRALAKHLRRGGTP